MYEKVKQEWLDAIINIDREKADAIIEAWIQEKGYDNVLSHILRPALEALGEHWTRLGDITFAQVYVSTVIAEDTILRVFENDIKKDLTEHGETIILGNIEDDFHSLVRRLVATFLKSSGWQVIDMGVDVTAEEFVDKAIEEKASIIMVSAMLYTTAKNIKKVREEIDNRGLSEQIALIVGGAVFNIREELWKEVGADAVGINALDAGSLAMDVLNRIRNQA